MLLLQLPTTTVLPPLQTDKLYRQHGIHRDPSHELRSVCFTALQMALDTKRPKFVTMGLNGLHVSDEMMTSDKIWHIFEQNIN